MTPAPTLLRFVLSRDSSWRRQLVIVLASVLLYESKLGGGEWLMVAVPVVVLEGVQRLLETWRRPPSTISIVSDETEPGARP